MCLSHSPHHRCGVSFTDETLRFIFACCKLASSNRIAIKTLKKSMEHWKLQSGCGYVQYVAIYCRFLVEETNKLTNNKQKDYPAIMTSKLAYKSYAKPAESAGVYPVRLVLRRATRVLRGGGA